MVLIVVTLRIQTPSSSLYPEIDIASKIATEDSYKANPFAPTQSLAQLLWPLSNSESLGIRRRLALSRFFVRLSDNEYEGSRRVVLTLQENDMRLPKRGQASKAEMSTAYRTEELSDDTTNYRAQYL